MSDSSKSVVEGRDASDASWPSCALDRDDFISLVWEKGSAFYRDLPWRDVDDPYAVMVSEVMLQQTQVSRVKGFWSRWMDMFPTVDSLAAADTASVLEAWQGLGYNRRALALKRACGQCSENLGGRLPETVPELVKLPGIGPATAGGIVAFAFNKPAVYIETNVRSVFLHELFPDSEGVSDKQLEPFVVDTCPERNVRAWYYALLDYGAHLKSAGTNPSRRSRHYSRQDAFQGSRREKRSFVLRQVLACPEGIDESVLFDAFVEFERAANRTPDVDIFAEVVEGLLREGFFKRESTLLVP